jgi:DNA-binding NarL/FixJ family response regulator
MRAGLRLLIEREPGIKVVGEASTLRGALQVATREQPSITLVGLLVGTDHDLDDLPLLLLASKDARALALTGTPDVSLDRRAVKAGAMGLISSQVAPNILIKAIQKVHMGEAWLDRCTVADVLTEMSRPVKQEHVNVTALQIGSLTKRERDIIKLVSRGYKNKLVAQHLAISDVTVRHHLTSIFSKLELTDRFELIIYAYKNGMADMADMPEHSDSDGTRNSVKQVRRGSV